MTLDEKVNAVEGLFHDLDNQIAQFQSASTLHCKSGCGKCCFHPDIEATTLEFLPFAHHLYREGQTEVWLEKFSDDSAICKILNPTREGAGLCSEYVHRGLICRLFGYSARTNKYGKKELVTCQIIKTEQPEAYSKTVDKLEDMNVPVMSEYYMRLEAIDPSLTERRYPINVAIRKAVEEVLHYYSYRSDSN